MIVRIGITVLALSLFSMAQGEAFIASKQQVVVQKPWCPPHIRVRIAHSIPTMTLEVCGSFNIVDPYEGKIISQRTHGKHERLLETRALGLKWGEEFPGVYQLQIVPTAADSLVVINGTSYRGIVTFYDVGGAISVVNDVTVEDYVAAQLANQSEFSNLEGEVVAALAIAMRSQAYYQVNHPKNPYWDVDGQKVAYKGLVSTEAIKAAESTVNATRFMVVTRPYEGQDTVDVVPMEWSMISSGESKGIPELVISEAVVQAQGGADAAQILHKVVPGIAIQRLTQGG